MTMLTEQEARTKWCPHARTFETGNGYVDGVEVPLGAATNREPGDYDLQGGETVVVYGRNRCIGSRCMAWRWRPPKVWIEKGATPPSLPADYVPVGFCGAFGRPA